MKKYILDKKTGQLYIPENFNNSKNEKELLETIGLEILIPHISFHLNEIKNENEREKELEKLIGEHLPKIVKNLVTIYLPELPEAKTWEKIRHTN